MREKGSGAQGARRMGAALLAVALILAATYFLVAAWVPQRPSGQAVGRASPAAAATPMIPHPPSAVPADDREEAEPVQLLWEQPLASVIGLALSPDGGALAVLSPSGAGSSALRSAVPARRDSLRSRGESLRPGSEETSAKEAGNTRLRIYSRNGRLRWERWIEGCSQAVVGRGGDLVATYEPRSALLRTLSLWSGEGRVEGAWRFDEPITAVTLADDGRRVAVGSDSGEVRLLRREGAVWRRSPGWQAEPPVHAIAFGPGDAVWVLAGVLPVLACYAPDGALLWRSRPWDGGARSVSFSVSADGQFAVVAGEREPPGTVEVQLWSARGRPLWRASFGGRAPLVRLAGAGQEVIVAYERALSRRDRGRVLVERALIALDRTGSERWRKGGAFSSPLLIAVEPHGDWVLSLGPQSRFWLMGRQGEKRWRSISYPPVQVAVGSRNGRSAAAYRVDGRLMMLAIEK